MYLLEKNVFLLRENNLFAISFPKISKNASLFLRFAKFVMNLLLHEGKDVTEEKTTNNRRWRVALYMSSIQYTQCSVMQYTFLEFTCLFFKIAPIISAHRWLYW